MSAPREYVPGPVGEYTLACATQSTLRSMRERARAEGRYDRATQIRIYLDVNFGGPRPTNGQGDPR